MHCSFLRLVLYAYLRYVNERLIIKEFIITNLFHDHTAATVWTKITGNLSIKKNITAQVAYILIGYFQVFSSSFLCTPHCPCTAYLSHILFYTGSNHPDGYRGFSLYLSPRYISGKEAFSHMTSVNITRSWIICTKL